MGSPINLYSAHKVRPQHNNIMHQGMPHGNSLTGLFPAAQYAVETARLNRGDLIFAYTDGVNEAKNLQGEQFGESRIMEITNPQDNTPDNFLRIILDAIYEFRGAAEQSDDITMLALKYQSQTSTA